MNRRNFFKRTLGVTGGVVAAFAPSKAKSNPLSTISSSNSVSSSAPTSTGVVEPQKRIGYKHVMTFEAPIVSVCEFHGRCLVACDYSIWEVYEDYEGELKRKLVRYT